MTVATLNDLWLQHGKRLHISLPSPLVFHCGRAGISGGPGFKAIVLTLVICDCALAR